MDVPDELVGTDLKMGERVRKADEAASTVPGAGDPGWAAPASFPWPKPIDDAAFHGLAGGRRP
jgi:hypothetical protein